MDKTNLYWQMYLNLEDEFLKAAEYVLIDDKQLSVYSLKNADLLMSVSTQIEAISKQLFFDNGGTTEREYPYFDTDCLGHLKSKWDIERKEVDVVSPFVMMSARTLTPLEHCSEWGNCKWKNAYQAVKHDRLENIDKASAENLLHALAALYLLNIYNRNCVIDLGSDGEGKQFDGSLGSRLFAVRIGKMKNLAGQRGEFNYDADCRACAYLVRNEEKSIEKWYCFNHEIVRAAVTKLANAGYSRDAIMKNAIKAQIEELRPRERELNSIINGLRYEAALNKLPATAFGEH